MKLAAILISVIGVALFGFMVFASHNSYQTNYNFRIALVLGSLMMITAFVYIIALYFQGLREIRPLLIGGLFGLIAALCDVASLLSTQYTLFWVQGFGIFIFLISVFLSMAGRTTRMHRELEGYMKGIQVEVERRTGQLNDSNVALSRASKAKSDFLAHMSHEIRTPLNSIMGFAQILEQRNQSEIDRYYIGLILKESDHLMQLISQILDLSRIEQGKLILDSENFHLKSAFNSVVEGLSQSAAQKGLLLEVCLADELPEFVTGDLLRFQQILINILGNSIKFTQTGKIRLEARAIAIKSSQDQIIEISVIDTGIGITNDKLETIFNRFEQGDNSITRKYGGTGLGLTIARDLVHLMGGEIHISSTPNVCTRVNLTVRFVKSEQLVETKSSSDVQQVTQWHPPQNCQVLVVDDYASNLEVVRIFLSKAGIQMIGAQSGKDALEIFRQEGHTINAILMDIHMPEMDGWETTRRIKELDNGANCPVIALTADAFKETAQNCQKFGIQDILTKPLHYETLIATLAHNLAAHQSPFTKPPRNFDTLILNNNIIDYRHLSESYFGDEEIINQLLVLFVDSGASLLTELQDALEDYQIGIIHLKAHAIKGGALNVGAVKIALSASHLEQLAKKHADPHVLKKDFKVLEQDWKDFVYELTRSGFIKS